MNTIYLREFEYKYYQKFNLIPFTSKMAQNNIKSMHSESSYERIRQKHRQIGLLKLF